MPNSLILTRLAVGERALRASRSAPDQPMMGTLGAGKGHRFGSQTGGDGRHDLYLDALKAQELDARPSVGPTAPVAPEEGGRTDDEWMQEHTHLARLRRRAAIPLTLLAQGTGTTTADAGSIDHAQTSIGFLAPFVNHQ